MRVLLVSSEVVPFSKTGGLADVAGALPQALARRGLEVAVATPLYGSVRRKEFAAEAVLNDIHADFGGTRVTGALRAGRLPGTEVPVYFVDCPAFYDRETIYGENGKDYADNLERFSFLCQAVLQFVERSEWKPDILHLHDWQAALIAVYLRTWYREHPVLRGLKTLYTIHNLAYQGLFAKEKLAELHLPWDVYQMDGLEFFGKISLMKGGIAFSDKTSTVSERYAEEIQTPEFGCGLEGILTKRRSHLAGILNGVDYTAWNPGSDPYIAARYSAEDVSGKKACKAALQQENGFEVSAGIPLLGVVSRLTEQKGCDLIAKGFDRLMREGVQFVLLGNGDPTYHEAFERLARRHPRQAAAHLTFDNAMAHRIEAGADMFLMPSRYEPCGLNQMYSLKYGAVPVVRETGGLADTVTNYHTVRRTGNGFVFRKPQAGELLRAVQRGLKVYARPDEWLALMRTGMLMDFSWDRAAAKYEEVFESLTGYPRS